MDGSRPMQGNRDMDDNAIIGIRSFSQDNAALTVGSAKAIFLPLAGSRSMQANLNMGGNPIKNLRPFVKDDSSQAAQAAQRNNVINFGYFHTQRGELNQSIRFLIKLLIEKILIPWKMILLWLIMPSQM